MMTNEEQLNKEILNEEESNKEIEDVNTSNDESSVTLESLDTPQGEHSDVLEIPKKSKKKGITIGLSIMVLALAAGGVGYAAYSKNEESERQEKLSELFEDDIEFRIESLQNEVASYKATIATSIKEEDAEFYKIMNDAIEYYDGIIEQLQEVELDITDNAEKNFLDKDDIIDLNTEVTTFISSLEVDIEEVKEEVGTTYLAEVKEFIIEDRENTIESLEASISSNESAIEMLGDDLILAKYLTIELCADLLDEATSLVELQKESLEVLIEEEELAAKEEAENAAASNSSSGSSNSSSGSSNSSSGSSNSSSGSSNSSSGSSNSSSGSSNSSSGSSNSSSGSSNSSSGSSNTTTTTPDPEPEPEPEVVVPSAELYTSADTSAEADMLRLLNEERVKVGLHELTYSSSLYSGAYIRGYEIAEVFSHTRPNGSGWNTVSDDAWGENICMNYAGTASYAVNQFMNSPGHKANMLGEGFTKVAFKRCQYNGAYYWVQLFG